MTLRKSPACSAWQGGALSLWFLPSPAFLAFTQSACRPLRHQLSDDVSSPLPRKGFCQPPPPEAGFQSCFSCGSGASPGEGRCLGSGKVSPLEFRQLFFSSLLEMDSRKVSSDNSTVGARMPLARRLASPSMNQLVPASVEREVS